MKNTTNLKAGQGGRVALSGPVRQHVFDPGEGVKDIKPSKDAWLASTRRHPNYALADAFKKAGAYANG